MFVKYLYSVVLVRDLFVVFGNVFLKYLYVFQLFIRMIKDYQYGIFYFIFFQSLENDNFVYIIVFGFFLKNLKLNYVYVLLIGFMRINKGVFFGVKGISFVIYYGYY